MAKKLKRKSKTVRKSVKKSVNKAGKKSGKNMTSKNASKSSAKSKLAKVSPLKSRKKPLDQKFIFVTGGVISSIGKGLSAASLASLLEARGIKVSLMKCDPYINVDPGTMSPLQHGEVYVTDDGAETDLDLGHYERFTTVSLNKSNSVSAGQVYESVIAKERRGEFFRWNGSGDSTHYR